MAIETVNAEEHDKLLNENQKVVTMFTAGWCGSCRMFKPKFKRLSDDERFEGITFLNVDAEKNPDLRQKAGVNNVPYFTIWEGGELKDGAATNKEDRVVELLESLKG